MSSQVFLNDDFVSAKEACVHINDLALTRGYGVFDFFRTEEHTPLFLSDHLERLYQSAGAMHLPLPYTPSELSRLVYELMQKNDIANSGIRITLTGGYAADNFSIGKPNLIITQQPFPPPDEAVFQKGTRLITYPFCRQFSTAKTIDYLMGIWLQPLIKERAANDVLYHSAGLILECPRANFFMVTREGKLITPKENILKGITRKQLINYSQVPCSIEERDVSFHDLASAKEAFITSTTKTVLPVVAIDNKLINNGKPGPVTRAMKQVLLHRINEDKKAPARHLPTP